MRLSSGKGPIKRLRCLAVIAFVLPRAAALGDGCNVPERPARKIPEIAAQQAVLVILEIHS